MNTQSDELTRILEEAGEGLKALEEEVITIQFDPDDPLSGLVFLNNNPWTLCKFFPDRWSGRDLLSRVAAASSRFIAALDWKRYFWTGTKEKSVAVLILDLYLADISTETTSRVA